MLQGLQDFMAPVFLRCEKAKSVMARCPMTAEAVQLFAQLQKDIATVETLSFLAETAPESMSPDKIQEHVTLVQQFVMANLSEDADRKFVAAQLLKIANLRPQNVLSYKNVLAVMAPFFAANMLKAKGGKSKNKEEQNNNEEN